MCSNVKAYLVRPAYAQSPSPVPEAHGRIAVPPVQATAACQSSHHPRLTKSDCRVESRRSRCLQCTGPLPKSSLQRQPCPAFRQIAPRTRFPHCPWRRLARRVGSSWHILYQHSSESSPTIVMSRCGAPIVHLYSSSIVTQRTDILPMQDCAWHVAVQHYNRSSTATITS